MIWRPLRAWLKRQRDRLRQLRVWWMHSKYARVQARRPFAFLRDNIPLTPQQREIAHQVQKKVLELLATRKSLLKAGRLLPEIDLPHGVWEPDSRLYQGSQIVLNGDATVLNTLRMYSQCFTGYRLATLEMAEGKPHPREVPPDLDEWLEQRKAQYEPAVEAYEKLVSKLPGHLSISPPPMFGEIGWVIGKSIVSYDTFVYLERITLLHECGILDRLRARSAQGQTVRILEIGPGFGGLAYHLKTLIPNSRYVAVDLPESLVFSGIYLSVLFGDEPRDWVASDKPVRESGRGLTFVSNFQFTPYIDASEPFDLAINTLSLSEMSNAQIRHYCVGLKRCLKPEGVFFEQNHDNRSVGHQCARDVIAEYFPATKPIISTKLAYLRQGSANLWANGPTALGPSMSHNSPPTRKAA